MRNLKVAATKIAQFRDKIEWLAPPQADERFSFADTSRQMKKGITQRSLRLERA